MDRQCSSCGGFCKKSGCERENVKLAPQRHDTPAKAVEWVGLTDEEIDNINYTSAHMLAREVEAKLKQKNGYAKENT
jgi:hypothetical protein